MVLLCALGGFRSPSPSSLAAHMSASLPLIKDEWCSPGQVGAGRQQSKADRLPLIPNARGPILDSQARKCAISLGSRSSVVPSPVPTPVYTSMNTRIAQTFSTHLCALLRVSCLAECSVIRCNRFLISTMPNQWFGRRAFTPRSNAWVNWTPLGAGLGIYSLASGSNLPQTQFRPAHTPRAGLARGPVPAIRVQ